MSWKKRHSILQLEERAKYIILRAPFLLFVSFFPVSFNADLISLQCRRFFRARKCFWSRKRHVETSRREEELGPTLRLPFLLSAIFHCHKIKDGGYSDIPRVPEIFSRAWRGASSAGGRHVFSLSETENRAWKVSGTQAAIRTRTRFLLPKIRLHCRLRLNKNREVV